MTSSFLSGPLPFSGDRTAWQDAVGRAARNGAEHGGDQLQLTERTCWGWLRWRIPLQHAAPANPDAAHLVAAGIYAPGWTAGWRLRLLRALWTPRPGISGVDVCQALLMLCVSVACWGWLGTALRGSTAVTVPAALGLLTAVVVPALARALTHHQLRVCPAGDELSQILAARQSLASAAQLRGERVPELRHATAVGHRLLWHAAGPELRPTAVGALVEAARELAVSAHRAAGCAWLVEEALAEPGPSGLSRPEHGVVALAQAQCELLGEVAAGLTAAHRSLQAAGPPLQVSTLQGGSSPGVTESVRVMGVELGFGGAFRSGSDVASTTRNQNSTTTTAVYTRHFRDVARTSWGTP